MIQAFIARVFYSHCNARIDSPLVAIMMSTVLNKISMKPEFLDVAVLFK